MRDSVLLSSLALLALPLVSCAAAPTGAALHPQGGAYGDGPAGRFTILLGQRSLEEDDYAPVEDQGMIALEVASVNPDIGVGFELGVSGSGDSEDAFVPGVGVAEVTGTVGELYVGPRFEVGSTGVRPFVAFGLSLTHAEIEVDGSSFHNTESDGAFGFYVHGGVALPISDALAIVADVRARFGEEYDIAGVDIDGDFVAFAVGISIGF